ncbi:TetR/AcrR family transcriptional regulator [Geodermatophilus sp. SYSU D00691]
MPRGTDIRAALIRATTELIAEVGYHNATTRVIAERAGVAEGSIYRHFPDKRALFVAALVEGQQGLTEWMAELPSRAGSGSLVDVLTEAFDRLSRLREHIVPLELAMAGMPDLQRQLDPASLSAAVEGMGGPPALLADYLRAEQALGRVRPDLDPVRTAITLLACLFGVQTSPLASPDGMGEAALRDFVALLIHGIASPAGTHHRRERADVAPGGPA